MPVWWTASVHVIGIVSHALVTETALLHPGGRRGPLHAHVRRGAVGACHHRAGGVQRVVSLSNRSEPGDTLRAPGLFAGTCAPRTPLADRSTARSMTCGNVLGR